MVKRPKAALKNIILAVSILGFILIINILRFSPIFTDEISFKLIFARFFLDSGKAIFFFPQCKTHFLSSFPIHFIPFRMIDSFFYGDLTYPVKLRIGGICYFLIYQILFIRISRVSLGTIEDNKLRNLLFSITINNLGILPFLLTFNRPEMPILIFASLLILIPNLFQEKTDVKATNGKIFLFSSWVCSAGILSYHAKGLCFLPLFIFSSLHIARNRVQQVLSLTVIGLMAWSSFNFWTKQFDCPLDQLKRTNLTADYGISHMSSPANLRDRLKQILTNLKQGALNAKSAGFQSDAMEKAEKRAPLYFKFIWRGWNYLFYFFLIFLGGIILGAFIVLFKTSPRQLLTNPYHSIFLACVISILGNQAITIRKPFYDLSLLIPLFFLIVLLALRIYPNNLRQRLFTCVNRSAIFLGIISQILLIFCYQPLIPSWTQGGILKDNYFCSSAYNVDQINERVVTLGKKCGISIENNLRHLVVDEISYSSFWKSKEPYFALFTLSCYGHKQLERNPIEFLEERESDGFIGLCRYLTPELLPLAKKDNDLCCVRSFKK